MTTLIAVLALAAASIVIFLGLLGLRRTRRAVLKAVGGVFSAIVFACRGTAAAVDFVLSPRAGVVAPWKYAAWVVINLIPLAIVAIANAPPVAAQVPAEFPVAELGYLLVAAGLFQALVLCTALIAAHDDYDVMEGLIAVGRRRVRGARMSVALPVVSLAIVLFLLYAVAVVYWLEDIRHVDLLANSAGGGVAIIDDTLAVLWALPTSVILAPIDWFLGVDSTVAFSATSVGRACYVTLFAIGWALLIGFAALLFQMAWQLRRTVIEIGESREGEQHQVMARARRAPPIVRRGILNAAVSLRDGAQQKRHIEAARDLGLIDFPQAFSLRLDSYSEEIQQFGLERSLELYRQRVQEFDRDPCEAIIEQCARHLERGMLGVEILKRVVRMMVAVLATKRSIVRIDERLQATMLASITRELQKPREVVDPAYRGVLQDLRGAVSRLSKPKDAAPESGDWIKRLTPAPAEHRAVRPETPVETVH